MCVMCKQVLPAACASCTMYKLQHYGTVMEALWKHCRAFAECCRTLWSLEGCYRSVTGRYERIVEVLWGVEEWYGTL